MSLCLAYHFKPNDHIHKYRSQKNHRQKNRQSVICSLVIGVFTKNLRIYLQMKPVNDRHTFGNIN